MGYACPVCSAPQPDGEHLANHLAFSALLHGNDHETWLAERVPDWTERDPARLAAAVVPAAPETEIDAAATRTVDESLVIDAEGEPGRRGDGQLDPVARQAIEDARALTRKRQAEREE